MEDALLEKEPYKVTKTNIFDKNGSRMADLILPLLSANKICFSFMDPYSYFTDIHKARGAEMMKKLNIFSSY